MNKEVKKSKFINNMKKIGLPIAIIIFLVLFLGFLVILKYRPGLGTSGTYICNYLDPTNDEITIYAKLDIGLNNKCILTYYMENDKKLSVPDSEQHNWSIRYQLKKPEGWDERIPFSNFQFSFENSKGGSKFQFCYFPNEQIFISKTYTPFLENGLVIFKKYEEFIEERN